MIEEHIFYKLIDNKYHFCYYSIDGTIDARGGSGIDFYSLQYCQGEVGDFPDYEVEIDKDIDIIRRYKDELVKTYNIKKIPYSKIDVSINLERFLKEFGYDKFNGLFNHISRTIDFVSKTSGIGINNYVVPSSSLTLEAGVYQTVVLAYNKEAFKRIFIDLITTCGIMITEVKIN